MQRNEAKVPGGILDQAPPAAQLDQPAAAPQAPPERPQTAPRTRTKQGLYDRVGMSLALSLGLGVAFLLWLAGAFFTLQFLKGMGVALAGAGLAQWLIPAAITAGELWLWPRASTRPQQTALFLLILAFDVGTSLIGLRNWAAGREIPNVGTLPAAGWGLWAGALVVSLVCAFWPEKLGRWSVSELLKAWR
jgi:hypothetical protein